MSIVPNRTALVAMDFQPTILGTLPDSGPVLANAAAAVVATRGAGGTVATVRVAFTDDDLAAFPSHSAMGQRMRSLADKVAVEAPSTRVVRELGTQEEDIAVRKTRVGPFCTTNLDAQLKAKGIDTIVFAGIHTSGCVLTGVREAHDLDYRIIVLSDACADPDPSAHEFLIRTIFPRQARVLSVADYRTELG